MENSVLKYMMCTRRKLASELDTPSVQVRCVRKKAGENGCPFLNTKKSEACCIDVVMEQGIRIYDHAAKVYGLLVLSSDIYISSCFCRVADV